MTMPDMAGAGPGAPDPGLAPEPAAAPEPGPAPEPGLAPEPAAAPGTHPWQRLSARSMIVGPLTDLTRLLPLLAALLILHRTRTVGGLIWGVVLAGLAVVRGLVHWATTRYLITDERVYLRHGLLNTRTLSVARDRVRTVDVTAHLLHRALGVCRVSIGTGRNDLRGSENFHLDGLTRSDAEGLRALLLAREALPAGPADGQAAAQAQPSGELARLEAGWLRFAPLTTTGLVVLGVLFGSVLQLNNVAQVNLARTGPVRQIVADFASLPFAQRIVVGMAVAVAGYMLVAIVGYIAAFWNFRLVRHGTETLRITRGLLSVRATTISLARLRGVEISEPLLLRAARGARGIAITTGLRVGRGAEHEGSLLMPPAPRIMIQNVAADVLAVPLELCAGPLSRHGPAARRRRYVRALAGALAIVGAVGLLTWLGHASGLLLLASLALLPVAAAVAADRYRSLGHKLADGWLVTRFGSLARRRSILGTDAIIGWRMHQTWFQRRQGLMTLTATTAAGHQHYSVRDVPVSEGLALATAATGELIRPFLAS
jgi:putative membrane protein